MMRLWLLSLVTFCALAVSQPSFALNTSGGTTPGGTTTGGTTPGGTTTGGTTPGGTTPGGTTTGGESGGSCDFTAIKNSLYGTESASAGGYSAICRNRDGSLCSSGARGKYQFIPATRSSYIRNHPECNGGPCDSQEAWITSACNQVQECIMNAYLADSLSRMRRSPSCQQLLNSGQTYTGSGQGRTLSCRATESGILGAMHLGGNNGETVCRGILNRNGSSDGLNTSTTYYMCKHGGLAVPGQCTGNSAQVTSDPNVDQPPATQAQINTGSFGENPVGGPLDPLKEWWVAGLMQMAEQFTANMAKQVEGIGKLLDAKHQLETQRLFQQKMAEAHKDYQPSEQMCTFGTFVRDLSATDRTMNVTRLAVAHDIMNRELGAGDTIGVSEIADRKSRLKQFRDRFCDQSDNGKGLNYVCQQSAAAETRNADINYTQTLDKPLSLKIDLDDGTTTLDEETVFALIDNLFAHSVPGRIAPRSMEMEKFQYQYMNMRSIIAMRGIARNTFANIIALKTQTPNNTGNNPTSGPYMKALMVEFGLTPEEIEKYLGENPSYYAQMELLTKKIYQHPNFYTLLYDKPTNVKRIRATMQAIKLMQDRDIQAALHRREMLLSMMLELRLRVQAEGVYDATERAIAVGADAAR
jgi:hypothetical protein